MRGKSVRPAGSRQLKLFRLRGRAFPSEPPPPPMRLLFLLPILALASTAHAAEPMDLAPVKKWIARQDDFHSVQADFTQTRAFRALRGPLARPGHLTSVAHTSVPWARW